MIAREWGAEHQDQRSHHVGDQARSGATDDERMSSVRQHGIRVGVGSEIRHG